MIMKANKYNVIDLCLTIASYDVNESARQMLKYLQLGRDWIDISDVKDYTNDSNDIDIMNQVLDLVYSNNVS